MTTPAHKIRVYAKSSSDSATDSDLIDGINDQTYQELSELLDATTFKSASDEAWRKRVAGLSDGTITLSGDFVASDAPQALLRSSRRSGATVYITVLLDPDASAGAKGFRVPCLVESIEASGAVDGKAETSITLQFNGEPTDV